MDYEATSDVLKAIAHPVRLQILHGLLMTDRCSVGEMAEKMGLPQSTVSQHLGQLRSRGIITPRKEGVRTCYRVVDARMKKLLATLDKETSR